MDQPQDHEVGRDAHEHVNDLHAQVEDDDLRHVAAHLVHCAFSHRDIGDIGGVMCLHRFKPSADPKKNRQNKKTEIKEQKIFYI